jgi:NADH-quinone oxidoreductase subunit G
MKSVRAASGTELDALAGIRDALAKEPELVILFNDAIKGGDIRRLVEFGQSLGIPVKYCPLLDYSNSRGAIDMGLVPELLPGYQPSQAPGMTLREMLESRDLDVLWVVGANPLKEAQLASESTFVVVQDMFMTETAQRADVVLPVASAYEKNGTVTNVCGEVQRLKRALSTIGTKPDLEIIGLIAKEMGLAAQMGPWLPEAVYNEIRRSVKGYDIPLALVTVGAQQTAPVNGRVNVESRPDLVWSAHDNLFTSGTLGRYSKILNSVIERRLTHAHPDKEEYVRK